MVIALYLVLFLSSLVGLVSASHLVTVFIRKKMARAVDMTKIGTAILWLTVVSVWFAPPDTFFSAWLRLFVSLFMFFVISFLLAKWRQRRLEPELIRVLDGLIMRMRRGCSLGSALTEELSRNALHCSSKNSAWRVFFMEIVRAVSFSQQENVGSVGASVDAVDGSENERSLSPKMCLIVIEFRRISQLPLGQTQELERWKKNLELLELFRRKSKSAMAPARAQAIVLGIIYGLLLVFTTKTFGYEKTIASIRLSAPLFFLGGILIWKGGGRVKWTV